MSYRYYPIQLLIFCHMAKVLKILFYTYELFSHAQQTIHD